MLCIQNWLQQHKFIVAVICEFIIRLLMHRTNVACVSAALLQQFNLNMQWLANLIEYFCTKWNFLFVSDIPAKNCPEVYQKHFSQEKKKYTRAYKLIAKVFVINSSRLTFNYFAMSSQVENVKTEPEFKFRFFTLRNFQSFFVCKLNYKIFLIKFFLFFCLSFWYWER